MSAHWQVGMAQGRPASADAEPAGIGLPEQVGENRTGGAPNAATGKQSSWNQFLKDSYLLGVRQAQASAGAHAAGGPTSGSLFQLAGDLSQALAGNHTGAVAGALRQAPRLSQWLQNGLNFNLGSNPLPGPGAMAREAGPAGNPSDSSSSFGLGFHSSLTPSGMPSGSASATYAAHSTGGRLGFSASASAGVGGSSAGISSFGGSGASGLGAMMNAQMHSGLSASPPAGMSGGPGGQGGGPGGAGGPGHGGGSNLPNATVHLKLTF